MSEPMNTYYARWAIIKNGQVFNINVRAPHYCETEYEANAFFSLIRVLQCLKVVEPEDFQNEY